MHGAAIGPMALLIGIVGLLFTMAGWWRDCILEGEGGYPQRPLCGARPGEESAWSCSLPLKSCSSSLRVVLGVFRLGRRGAANPQVYGRLDFTGGIWPPKGTTVIDPLTLPLLNTFILVTSSFAVNVAHEGLLEGKRDTFKVYLALAVALGVLFAFRPRL